MTDEDCLICKSVDARQARLATEADAEDLGIGSFVHTESFDEFKAMLARQASGYDLTSDEVLHVYHRSVELTEGVLLAIHTNEVTPFQAIVGTVFESALFGMQIAKEVSARG